MNTFSNKKYLLQLTITTIFILNVSSIQAHNSFRYPLLKENTPTSWNAIVYGHGCGENTIIGSSMVFPNFSENPALTMLNTATDKFEPTEETIDLIYDSPAAPFGYTIDRSVFSGGDAKANDSGEAVGMWAGGGPGVPHSPAGAVRGFVSVRFQPGSFIAESCAGKIQFVVPMVDVCKITTIDGFKEGVVSIWIPEDAGSDYRIPGSNHTGDVVLTVDRDLKKNPLPETCEGGAKTYRVTPTSSQINRDMPVTVGGKRLWPKR